MHTIDELSRSLAPAAKSFLETKDLTDLPDLIKILEKITTYKLLNVNPETSDEESAKKLIKIAIPLESQIHHLGHIDEIQIHKAYSVLGTIFEYAAKITMNSEEQLDYLLRSSICHLCSQNTANSIVCASKAFDLLPDSKNISDNILQITLLFLMRKLDRVLTNSKEFLLNQRTELEKNDAIEDQFLLLGCVELVKCFHDSSIFLISGNNEELNWQKHISLSISNLQKSQDERLLWLSTRIDRAITSMMKNSLWNMSNSIPKEIIKSFTNNKEKPIFELWSSQVLALNDILQEKNRKHFSLVMPTSGGKTLVAAILAAKELLQTSGNCFYITPYRALVSEASEFLKKYLTDLGIGVSSLPGNFDAIQELENIFSKNSRLFVLTPEKMDLLWRLNDPRVNDCTMFIFDEVQNISEEGRGLRLELLISRIKSKMGHRARLVTLSAVIPPNNLSNLVEWLGGIGRSIGTKVNWSPTKKLESVFYRARLENNRGDLFYQDGFNIFGILPPTEKYTRRFDAVNLAIKYQRNLGPVLIYCNSRDEAENTASAFYEIESKMIDQTSNAITNDVVLDEIGRYFKQILGDVPLSRLIKKGIAYHHSSLPESIKKRIEKLAQDGILRVICSTSTLSEGVNLNVKTVIISSTYQGQVSMDGLKLRNLAGRAGRALRDTEGHVVLMDAAYLQSLTDENAAVFRSRFFEYLSSLTENPIFNSDIESLESDLLTRLYRKEISEKTIDADTTNALKTTFFAKQANSYEFLSVLSNLRNHAKKIISIPNLKDIQLKVFAETGLGIKSCQELDLQAKEIATITDFKFRKDKEVNWELIRVLIQTCILPNSRFGSRIQETVTDPASVVEQWLSGKTLLEITSNIAELPEPKILRSITQFLYGYVADEVSWINAALLKLIDNNIYQSKLNLDYEFYLLPSYLKYGVIKPAALLLCLLGFVDRDYVNKISIDSPNIDGSEKNWIHIISWILKQNNNALVTTQQRLLNSLTGFIIPISDYKGRKGGCEINNKSIIQDKNPVGEIEEKYAPLLRIVQVRKCSTYVIQEDDKFFLEINALL
jgi:replicative superfamily II helicase